MNLILWIFSGLLLLKLAVELGLNILNRQETLRHAGQIPPAFQAVMDEETYQKAVAYTLAKNRFGQFQLIFHTVILATVILSGVLPDLFDVTRAFLGDSIWAQGMYLVGVGFILMIPSIPLDLWSTFKLEQRFGFNTTTFKLWLADQIKGLLVGFAIGYPLVCLTLKLVDWVGDSWWLWAFGIMVGFQLLMMILYPKLILPLFNKLSPLPEGELKTQLMALADRTGFRAKTIQVMDGSKRSTHSNAFFTGFSRWRRIVLFDTLIEQLSPAELEAVLAHEIGHYKKGHVPKMLAISIVFEFIGFALIAHLAQSGWFYGAFGFALSDGLAPVFLLFSLLSGLVTFWFTPLFTSLSRKHEYEADAFAREAIHSAEPMISALRKLSEKNLSNLTPHPWFSRFYYSHPTLLERETALRQDAKPPNPV
ncbi:MAG: M48 family peptidase [Gemmatimonadetes bacterium]|nr:MAG: M48 family peptidase [Gemmatimonadota bacterium]